MIAILNKRICVRPQSMVTAAFSLLKFEPSLRRGLERRQINEQTGKIKELILDLSTLPLLLTIMGLCPLHDIEIEVLLKRTRSSILMCLTSLEGSPEILCFQSALALQCFTNEYIYIVLLMALTAIPVGFVAGLFGIGGGLITVPFLYFIFGSLEIDPQYVMHLAVGTSFAIIIPTSTVSVLTHHKFKAVDFDIVKNYGLFVVLGVIVGTAFAASLKTKSLVLFFSIMILFLGIYLLLIKEKEQNIIVKMKLHLKVILGFLVGFISAPMGIGGAVMNVPILKFFGYSINKAIGSAAAIGFLIALFGAIGFLVSGTYLNSSLPLSIGFINIPAFLIFIPITTFMARIGAKTVHSIDKNKISKFFGIFLLVISIKFFYEYLKL